MQYNFKPKLITSDFCLSNIKTINEVFSDDDVLIIPCFFIWFNVGGEKQAI